MIDIKTLNEIILNIINNIRTISPDVDTKEGTFLRDAIIDPVAKEINDLYTTLYTLDMNQSILTATGDALDRLAANYFITRKQGTRSTGTVRFYLANTQIANYDIDFSFPDIYIQAGTMLSTYGDASSPAIQFKTSNAVIIPGNTIKSLPRDSSGYQYRDIVCESVAIGADKNVGPNEIISLSDSTINGIQSITNLESFKNGTNSETDASLALRIGLAISGNNIGTKSGYLAFALKQPQVIDATVVGAGDPDMLRDEIQVCDGEDENGHITNICKPGGCVDIYVRTNTETQTTASCKVIGENATQDNTVVIYTNDISMKAPIVSIKSVLGERTSGGISQYVTYSPGDPSNHVTYEATNENKGDYYIGSTREVGKLIFNGTTIPKIGEKLTIYYTYNNGIEDLQELVDKNKILTADVLMKSAQPINIKLYLNTKCDSNYNVLQIENDIRTAINEYIDANIKMGSTIDITNIILAIKQVPGIITFDINSIGFTTGSTKELVQFVRCKPNQYINLSDIIMNNTYVE